MDFELRLRKSSGNCWLLKDGNKERLITEVEALALPSLSQL